MDYDPSRKLSEEEFFRWAIDKLPSLEEVIIVAHTPIMFFKEEQIGTAEAYFEILRDRFETGLLKTTYFLSQEALRKRLLEKQDLPSRIQYMRLWQKVWTKPNISARVVDSGYFPLVSLWLGKQGGKTKFTLIKMSFENASEIAPVWLRITQDISGIDEVISGLEEHSSPFQDFLQKEVNRIDSENRDSL